MADHIQIGDVAPRVRYTADGATASFTYPFPIFDDADLEVFVDGTQQSLGADYTVSGAGGSAGGSALFAAPPDAGAAVTLLRRLVIERTSDFQASGEFRAKVINDELDYQTAAMQQLSDDLQRSLRLSRFDAGAALELPAPETRAGKALGFNADGDVTVSGEDLSDIEGAATFAAAAAASAVQAENDADDADFARIAAEAARTAAQSSALAAAAAAASNLFATLVVKTSADSPYSVVADTDDGTLFRCDLSSGDLTMQLPLISAAGEGERYGFLRHGASQTLTLSRSGTDTINGIDGDYTVAASDGELIVVVADDDTPDNWIVVAWSQATADETTLTKSGSVLSVRDDGVTTAKIAPAALKDLAGLPLSAGDVLYYDGAGLERLPAGTNGQVLSLASGVPAWTDLGSPLTVIATATASNSPVIDFTIDDDYDVVTLYATNLRPATNEAAARLLVSSDGGSTFLSSNYSAVNLSATGGSVSAEQQSLADWNFSSTRNDADGFLIAEFIRPRAATHTIANVRHGKTHHSGSRYLQHSFCIHEANAVINAVRFQFSSGAISTGTFLVTGLKSS